MTSYCPVERKGNRGSIVRASMKKSHLWQHCVTYKLEINMRVLNPKVNNTNRERLVSFSTCLLKIGSSAIEPVPRGTIDDVEIPKSMPFNSNSTTMAFVYNNLKNQHLAFEWLSSRAILTIKDTEVDNINNTVVEQIPRGLVSLTRWLKETM